MPDSYDTPARRKHLGLDRPLPRHQVVRMWPGLLLIAIAAAAVLTTVVLAS